MTQMQLLCTDFKHKIGENQYKSAPIPIGVSVPSSLFCNFT